MENVESRENLKTHLQNNQNVVCYFTADWCGPCRQLKPFVTKLAEANKQVKFLQVDADLSQDWDLGITVIPQIHIISNAEIKHKLIAPERTEMKEPFAEIGVSVFTDGESEQI